MKLKVWKPVWFLQSVKVCILQNKHSVFGKVSCCCALYGEERLPLPSNGTWENGVNQLWENVIKPSGFKVERLARVPYISEVCGGGAYI